MMRSIFFSACRRIDLSVTNRQGRHCSLLFLNHDPTEEDEKMKKSIPTITILILIFITPNLWADHLFDKLESLTFNPIGSGARALGMGGAFIGVADDATAGSWNPAGLIQLKSPEISVVGDFSRWIEKNSFLRFSHQTETYRMSEQHVNYLSLTFPFECFHRNVTISLNYQHLFAFQRDWTFSYQQLSPNDSLYRVNQSGQLSAIGLALCFQLQPNLAFGITFNFWEDWLGQNGWQQTTTEKGPVYISETTVIAYEGIACYQYDFKGFNINLGILWDITDHFTLGAVLKTPFSADLERTDTFQSISPQYDQSPLRTQSEKLDMPVSYGIGVAYRFSDQWTLAADIYTTHWQDLILTDANGDKYSFINGKKEEQSHVKPTHHFRLGLEYLMFNKNFKYIIPIRAGIFYDPMPADGSPDDYYGMSLGTGLAKGKYVFDIACQYRYGNNVGQDKLERFDFSQDVVEIRGYGSLIYYF